jgi:hypothetical protein
MERQLMQAIMYLIFYSSTRLSLMTSAGNPQAAFVLSVIVIFPEALPNISRV